MSLYVSIIPVLISAALSLVLPDDVVSAPLSRKHLLLMGQGQTAGSWLELMERIPL